MSKAGFQLFYIRPVSQYGKRDVYELASSLLATRDLLREANRALNVDSAKTSVSARPDFKKGLLEISLVLDQSLPERAKNPPFAAGGAAIGAGALVRILFGSEITTKGVSGVIENVLDLWITLKGEKPKTSVEDRERGVTTLMSESDNEVNVNSDAAALYDKEIVRSAIAGIVGPVAKRGIRVLEIRKGKRPINHVRKSDLPWGFPNAVSLLTPPLTPTPTPSGPIASQVADGEGWKTDIQVTNSATGGGITAFTLNFYGHDGTAQPFSFQCLGAQSTLTGSLAPLESVVFRTQGTGPAMEGWAQLVSSSSSLTAFTVFTNTNNGNQAAAPFGLPASGDLILPFDNTKGYGMGLALLTLESNVGQTIKATILDQNDNTLGTAEISLSALGHMAFDVASEWPVTANRKGVVIFQGAGALLGIRYDPKGALTTVTPIAASGKKMSLT